ncbi:MAG: hypothetical protein MR270_04710 [Erysipelotrichaceae bacterium]|nr:hypothetical protein [Erysipelotrichaceae bacterium]
MKNKFINFSLITMLSLLNGCSITNNDSLSEQESSSSIYQESSSSVYQESENSSSMIENNDKKIDDEIFKNPSLSYRPLVMMHSPSINLINDVYNRGYGGIVTNVSWDKNYLRNAQAFSRLSTMLDYLINDLGMYAYIYDEYGYPSGTAYGQTLKDNPEYEALGLVATYLPIKANGKGTIDLLYGHKAIEAAYVYDGDSKENMDLTSFDNVSSAINDEKNSISYINRSSNDKVLVAYMSKRWYENTHSMENWYAQQRYINMLEKKPAEKFIDLTYQKYYDELSEYFGDGIKAFFTDEPALQGSYFEISQRDRQVLDVPDYNIPIVECLNFSDSLFEVFKNTYGYDLKDNLAYLYVDDNSSIAKQVRMDFYMLTSNLFEDNYLKQIASWCDNKNVLSSGHLLLEESLYQNPWFSGDMIQLLGSMGMPGTDLLFSTPQAAFNQACIVSKMASSAANFTNKENTFAEISGAFDGNVGNTYEKLCAVGVQVAMGINNFASYYYQGNDIPFDEDIIFSSSIGRMCYMVKGSSNKSDVLLYYPYEGVSAETLPSKNMWNPTNSAKEISDSFTNMCQTLGSKQINYDLIDYLNLSKCNVEDGYIVLPNGNKYKAIVIPYTTAIKAAAIDKLKEAADNGVDIIINDFDEVVSDANRNDCVVTFKEIAKKAKQVSSANAAANYIRVSGYQSISLNDAYATKVYVNKKENKNYALYTIVNAFSEDKTYEIKVDTIGKVKYYNAIDGSITKIEATQKEGYSSFVLTLPSLSTGFIVVEK